MPSIWTAYAVYAFLFEMKKAGKQWSIRAAWTYFREVFRKPSVSSRLLLSRMWYCRCGGNKQSEKTHSFVKQSRKLCG
jgi:hypothetical protein